MFPVTYCVCYISNGSYNTATGSGALEQLGAGSGNTAQSENALDELVTGDYNTGIGTNTGFGLISGRVNTFIGAQIGIVNTLDPAISNTIIIQMVMGERFYVDDKGQQDLLQLHQPQPYMLIALASALNSHQM